MNAAPKPNSDAYEGSAIDLLAWTLTNLDHELRYARQQLRFHQCTDRALDSIERAIEQLDIYKSQCLDDFGDDTSILFPP